MIDLSLFQQIIAGFRSSPASGDDERRNQSRVLMNLRAPCVLVSKNIPAEPITVIVRELSTTGIGLMSPVKMRAAQQFVVTLQASGGVAVSLHGEVLRCEASGSGGNFYRIGATITRVDPPAAVG